MHNITFGERAATGRIFGDFLREVGLGRRERAIEIGDGFSLALAEIAFDLLDQSRPAPAMMDGGPSVPKYVRPCLQACRAGRSCGTILIPDLGKAAHILEIADRKGFYVGKLALQVCRQPINDNGAEKSETFCLPPARDEQRFSCPLRGVPKILLKVVAVMRMRWDHAKFREQLPSTGLVGYGFEP